MVEEKIKIYLGLQLMISSSFSQLIVYSIKCELIVVFNNKWTPNVHMYSHLSHHLLIYLQSPVKLMSFILMLKHPIHHRKMARTQRRKVALACWRQSQVTPKENDIRTGRVMQYIKENNQEAELVQTKWLQILGAQCWWANGFVLMCLVVFFCLLLRRVTSLRSN